MNKNNPQILVVEDEDAIRRFITLNLSAVGYEVMEAENGEKSLALLKKYIPDVVVLDLMLPGIDGLEVCRRIRAILPDTLVIMLTARGQDTDKILGLETGADDYMTKPFNPLELIARIKAMLRRRVGLGERNILLCGELYLDIRANKFYKRDLEIELTPIEFELLKMFMENPRKALKRNEILNAVWGEDYFGDTKTLDVHIRRLREKIEDNPSKPEYIKTVWGSGYRWQPTSGRDLP